MIVDPQPPSSAVEIGGTVAPPTVPYWRSSLAILTSIFVLLVVVCPLISAFLEYPRRAIADALLFLWLICLLPIFILSLLAVLKRRWKLLPILAVAWLLSALPYLGVRSHLHALKLLGFQLHSSPLEIYLMHCQLRDFVENGRTQRVGPCESSWIGPIEYTVLYDSSGQFALRASQRTQGWRDAVSHFAEPEILLDAEDRVEHLTGDFFEIGINISDMRG